MTWQISAGLWTVTVGAAMWLCAVTALVLMASGIDAIATDSWLTFQTGMR